MVDQAMSIFEFLDKFLIFGHPLTPLGDGCASALFADNQSENEIDWSKPPSVVSKTFCEIYRWLLNFLKINGFTKAKISGLEY